MSVASDHTRTAEPLSTATVDARIDYLDGIRAIAALCVMVSHMWLQVWPLRGRTDAGALIAHSFGLPFYGHFAVAVFLVLSGFCLAIPVVRNDGICPPTPNNGGVCPPAPNNGGDRPPAPNNGGVRRRGWREFMWRRSIRILPPYYAGCVLSILIILAGVGRGSENASITARGVVSHVLLLQNIVDRFQINPVYWSIAVEYQIYFLFPLLILAFRRFGAWSTTAVAFAASFVWDVIVMRIGWHIAAPHYLVLFVVGIAGARAAFSTEAQARRRPWLIYAAGSAAVAGSLFYVAYFRTHTDLIDVAIAGVAVCLMIAMAHGQANALRRALSTKWLAGIGVFSYSLYLIHFPLVQAVGEMLARLRLGETSTFWALITIGSPLIVGASYLFFLAFERPFLPSRRRGNKAS